MGPGRAPGGGGRCLPRNGGYKVASKSVARSPRSVVPKKESAPARERSFSTSNHPPLTSGVGLAIRPERPYKHRQRLLAGHPPALTRHHLRHPLQRVQLAVLLSTVLLESLRRPHCHASLIAALLNAHAPAIREDSVYSPFAPHPQQARAAAPFAWSRVPHLLVDACWHSIATSIHARAARRTRWGQRHRRRGSFSGRLSSAAASSDPFGSSFRFYAPVR